MWVWRCRRNSPLVVVSPGKTAWQNSQTLDCSATSDISIPSERVRKSLGREGLSVPGIWHRQRGGDMEVLRNNKDRSIREPLPLSSKDTYPNCVHRHVSTQMICLQHISWGIRRSSLPHQGVHAQQRCNILPQLLLYLSPRRPLHIKLGHIFSEEIRESAHISREAIGATTLGFSVVCCGCQWLRIFKETCRDFLGALHRDGHHITRLPIRESCTCRQTVLKKSVKWILTHVSKGLELQ